LTDVAAWGHLPGCAAATAGSKNRHVMAKISGSDIRPGMVIEHDGSLWAAVKSMAVKPGKGPAYNQVELKNILDGRKLNQRFGGSDRVEETAVERRQFQFLYRRDDQLVFMDTTSYDQIELGEDFIGERAAFLQDGMMVQVQLHRDHPIGIKLPETVVLAVVEADAHIKGQTAASSYKGATLENGLKVLVPPFISAGEKVVVSTDEVSYVRRAD
jgi:elongation factor P